MISKFRTLNYHKNTVLDLWEPDVSSQFPHAGLRREETSSSANSAGVNEVQVHIYLGTEHSSCTRDFWQGEEDITSKTGWIGQTS